MKNFKIPKNILRQIFLIAFPLISFQIVLSQNISEKIFGQNAWIPNSIGTTIFNGKLDSQWNKVKDSHAKICRYGGIAVDKNMPTHTQYLNIIDSIRSNGMEPVMLVSFDNNKYTASQAAQTVEFINITSNKNVKYWVIGNEPDNSYGYVNSAQVADYVKRFSFAMKQKDASIKIIAPETAWYNQNILDGLLTPGGLSDITGKDSSGNFIVDLISFHTFPFRGIQNRNEVINHLTEPYQFEYNLTQLNQKIAACNSFHQRNSNSLLKIAVTEANIDWQNPQGDGIFGLGANSFLGGQFWAEMIGICMKKNVDFINFWSVIEGNELGYLYQASTLPKPSYYHFQMLADNFKGNYCNGTDNNTNIKSFGSKNDDQISVIILNQDQSNDFIYKLRLDTNLISGADPLKININAGTHIEFSDTAFRESTVLLIFNSNGFLNKKCIYKLYGNADQSIPPTCNMEAVLPQAKIISPANNSFFYLDSTITVLATASGGTGPIQKMEFFADTTKLVEDTIAPYSFLWNTATTGNYALTAKVSDSVNNTSVSEIVNITVTNPLIATVTAPSNNSSFNEGTAITIQALTTEGTGVIQKVEFFADTIKLGEDTITPYDFTWNNATAGAYALTAKATDSGNNIDVSEIINITVIIPLGVTIISPSNNSFFNIDSTITILVTTSGGTGPIQKVEFFADTTKLGEDTIVPHNFTWNNATAGNYALTAKVTDSVNNTSVSQIINITVTNPLTATVIAPINNSSFTYGSPITIQAVTSEGTGITQKVEFFADTIKLGEDLTSPYDFTWNNATAGNYALTVKATDSGNNTAVSSIIIIAVINPLSATITSPLNNSSFIAGSPVTIQATTSFGSGTIQKVEFFVDTTKLGEDLTSPYNIILDNPIVGNYTLTVKATDSIGNTAVSTIINITINNLLSTTIISPTNNTSFSTGSGIAIEATTSGGTETIQKVEFFADTIKLGEDLTSPYDFIWNNATTGTYALTAKATDSGNNTAISSIIIIAIINPLSATIISPLDNSSFIAGSPVTIQATTSYGTGTIQKVEFFVDTTKLGEDLTSPYNIILDNPLVGNYELTVKATDSIGNTAVSTIINITINNLLSTTIISPTNNTSFSVGSGIAIEATTSGGTGTIQKVEFFADSIKLGEDLTSPYNFIWNNATAGTYALTAKAIDSGSDSAVSSTVTISVSSIVACSATGTIAREVWSNVSGSSVSAIPLSINPSLTGQLTIFEAPKNFANNYGQRVSGYVCPPLTGNYIFWIASDNNSELWLSTDDTPANKQKIASVSGYTSSRQWTKYSTQQSASKNLIAGRNYYIEALHKEGTQGDNCAVGWQLPNGTLERPIPGTRLSPFTIPLLINISQPENNSSFSAGSNITIQAAVSGGTGTIQKVEFFADSTKIAEDETSPYSFVWNDVIDGNYELTARVTDSGNDSAVSSAVTISVSSIVACTATGTIAREVWSNVSGSSVSAIPLSINPSSTGQLTIFEAPQNFANNYGQRISGYVCPPLTGNYIFWIASDNNSELWLSTDDTPANKQKIASVSGYTSSRQWTKYSTQKSVSKNLIAGRNYYIEALHKEGSQGDNCAVGWQLPSGVQERPIPGNRLSPFELIPSIQLISAGSSWKYLDNGTNQGSAWRSTSFNDATWKTGNTEFGYGDGGEATVVSYGPSSTNKYITTYFRKTFNTSDISTISGLELSLIRDDGAVVYINGVEVYRNNLPTGTIFYNTLAPSIIDKSMESTYVIANISSSSLVNGTNHIAVEIHQNAKTSPDMSFNLKLKTLSGSRIMDNEITNDTTQENTILENTVEMIVYPNPNTGQFNLELCIDDLQEKNVVIEVTNSFGQVVYKKLPQKINGCIKETIELEAFLPTGVYIMKVTIDDKIQTAKMLLTK